MTTLFGGKVALITGGNSGIGRATSLAFAREGAAVVIAARDAEKGAETLRLLEEAPDDTPPALFLPTDVTDPEACAAAVARIFDTFGRLDVLVNNAGVIIRKKTVVETTPEEWDITFDVNVKGTYLMSRAAIPAMMAGGGGTIVNTASYLGVVGGKGVAAYAAAKGAVVNLTRAMALDHAPHQIRVNCVAPGSVDTPMLRKEWEDMGGEAEVRQLFEDKHPMGRISQPEEIARAILFLASPKASFITGVCLPVDAGLTAG